MIYSELKNYLVQSTSPETVALVERAVKALERLDPESEFMDTYDSVVGATIGQYDQDLIDAIVSTTVTMMEDVLQQHSIVTTEQATLSDKIEIVEALLMLQDWENKAEIEIALQTEGNQLEKLCGLFGLVHGKPVEYYLGLIDRFNPSLLDKVQEELLHTFEQELVDIGDIEQNLRDYQKVKSVYDSPSKLDDLLKYPGAIGQPFLTYLTPWIAAHEKYLGDELTPIFIQGMAADFMRIAALSKEGLSKAQLSVREHVHLLTTDLGQTGKIDAAVTQALLEVSRA